MQLTDEQLDGFNIALNEATLLGLEVDPVQRIASVTLRVLTLPEKGPAPEDPRVQLLLRPVGRVAASLRHGWWDDESAPVEPFRLYQLPQVAQSFGSRDIYGWQFLDVPEEKDFARWSNKLSLDWQAGSDGLSHTLILFQHNARHLDVCLWFDDLDIRDPACRLIPLDQFIAGGRRWWDGLFKGDPRTESAGIYPAGTNE